MKMHKRKRGDDYRQHGQTDEEYSHTTLCGYVRERVTDNDDEVTCKHCLLLLSAR